MQANNILSGKMPCAVGFVRGSLEFQPWISSQEASKGNLSENC